MNRIFVFPIFVFLSLNGLAQSYDSYELALENIEDVEYLTLFEESIDDRIYEFKNVVEIQLYDCYLDSLKEDIGNLKKLKKLLVHNSQLNHVVASAFSKSLIHLDLSSNQLKEIKFSEGNKIKHLNLSSNPVAIRGMQYMDSIEILILQDCGLERIPESIEGVGLRELNLSSNNLSKIPRSITKIKDLKKIDLSRNKIQTLDKRFFKITSLRVINLRSNLLRDFSKCFEKLPVVKRIDLSDNEIENLSKSYKFKELEYLSLRGNPGYNKNKIRINSDLGDVKLN